MPELKLLFLQMAVVLIATRLVAAAFRLIRQPEVLGEMTAGILLGPSLLGRIAPELANGLFPTSSLGPLYALSQIGLVLFMFIVGLEVDLSFIRGRERVAGAVSLASIALPFALVFDPSPRYDGLVTTIIGKGHGDLHTENILVRPDERQFWLIDLSRYRTDAPLTQDPVQLVLAIVNRALPSLRLSR